MVRYKKNKLDPKTAAGRIRKNSLEIRNRVSEKANPVDSVFLYAINDNSSVSDKIAALKNDPAVEIAQPDYIYQVEAVTPPNDPGWSDMWALNNTGQTINSTSGTSGDDVRWLNAWDKYKNDVNSEKNAVIVADIDTGFEYNHPDVSANNLWDGSACKNENGAYLGGCQYGYDYDYNKKDPMDTGMDSHGTFTGGIVAAAINNGVGVTGVAPDVKLMAIKADMQSTGDPGSFDTATLTKAIKFAGQNGAKIINMSMGGSDVDPLMSSAISSFPGLVVVSAGNESSGNDTTPVYPCNFNATLSNVICVAATDQNDALASFSNYGTNSVDIAAPGANIEGLYYDPSGTYYYAIGGGTSFSAPYVSGEAALLWSYKHTLIAAQVKSAILNTGDVKSGLNNIRQINNGSNTGGRRINIYKALQSIDPDDLIPPAAPSGLSVS